jgi:hypothetical protein
MIDILRALVLPSNSYDFNLRSNAYRMVSANNCHPIPGERQRFERRKAPDDLEIQRHSALMLRRALGGVGLLGKRIQITQPRACDLNALA